MNKVEKHFSISHMHMKTFTVWFIILASFQAAYANPQKKDLNSPIPKPSFSDKKNLIFGFTYASQPKFSGNYDLFKVMSKALEAIKSSRTFSDISNTKASIVSCQQISWGIYNFFFEGEIKRIIGNKKPEFNESEDDHLKEVPVFNRLNDQKLGKVLISFSGIYDNIFFAEIVPLNTQGDCYADRPMLAEIYVYMFHIKENSEVELVKVNKVD